MRASPRLLVLGGADADPPALELYDLLHGTGSTCPTHVAVVRFL